MANKADVDHVLTWARQPHSLRKEFKTSRPSILPLDLRNANLRDLDLSHLNFTDDDLRNVDLRGSLLNHSNLTDANLQSAWIERVNLDDAILMSADLRKSNLSDASMRNAQLFEADLQEALLDGAILENARAEGARFRGCKLRNLRADGANFSGAFFAKASLTNASLQEAKLVGTAFVGSDLSGANLDNAWVYGTSVWDCILDNSSQRNLLITKKSDPPIVVDHLAIAQYVYLIIENKNLSPALRNLQAKGALILGRFKPERKFILELIRRELRNRGYVPLLFDFEGPPNRTITETVQHLAGMSGFVIADVTDPNSIPQEIQAIVPNLSIPFLPIFQQTPNSNLFPMIWDHCRYPWVAEVLTYADPEQLCEKFDRAIVDRAENKRRELAAAGARDRGVIFANDL